MAQQNAADAPDGFRRRDLLFLGSGLLVGAGAVGAGVGIASVPVSTSTPSAAATTAAVALRRYFSTMVTAPDTSVWRLPGSTLGAGLIATTPQLDTNVTIPMLFDDQGDPVWIDPESRIATDVRVQTYRGKSVLTFWSGRWFSGHGVGAGVILDTSYRVIATVPGGLGYAADIHEFGITSRNTAMLISYPPVQADLRPVGGPENGWIFDCHVQEVEIATGEVRFDWNALDYLGVDETYLPRAGTGTSADDPFDAFHVNAVELESDGSYLVSMRHTHGIYSIDPAGSVRWRLGGKLNDFAIPADARFAWQHNARRHPGGIISLFDNHDNDPTSKGQSYALVLAVDESTRTVELKAKYANSHFGFAEGSAQLLPNQNVLVGWGKDPVATEFAADGTALFELRGLGQETYRVNRAPWTATPTTVPDIAAERTSDGSVRVFASWNGATDVASWRVRSGPGTDALTAATTAPRTGFETSVVVPSTAAVRVEALDTTGRTLAHSRTLAV
jgi:Arylsulfotransferase (ASST)